jgi:hypothetical protein
VLIKVFICICPSKLDGFLELSLNELNVTVFAEISEQALIDNIQESGLPDILVIDEESLSQENINLFAPIKTKYFFSAKQLDGWQNLKKNEWKVIYDDISSRQDVKVLTSDFSPIPIDLFKLLPKCICDIYLLKSKAGEKDYVKLFNKDEAIDEARLEGYKSKGVKFLNVEHDYKIQILNIISNNTYQDLIENDNLSTVDSGHKAAKELIKALGFSSASTQVVDAIIENFQTNLLKAKSPTASLIKNLLDTKGDVYFKKSYLINLVCFNVLKKFEWNSKSHSERITYMTLMSDLTLKDSEVLINTSERFSKAELTDESMKRVQNHAKAAHDLCLNFEERPFELEKFLLQHHGQRNGIGFNDTVPSHLNVFLQLYKTVEDFCVEILLKTESEIEADNIDIPQIISNLDSRYSSPKVKDYLNIIEGSFN